MAIRLMRIGRVDVDTSTGTFFHDDLFHRDYENQHPIYAITGLAQFLDILRNMIDKKMNIYVYDSFESLPDADNVTDKIALVKLNENEYLFYTYDEENKHWKEVNKQKDFDIKKYISDSSNLIQLDENGKMIVNPVVINSHSSQMIFNNVKTLDIISIPKQYDILFSSIGFYKVWKKVLVNGETIFQSVSPLNYIEQQTKETIDLIWKDEDCEEVRINFETNHDTQQYAIPKLIFKEWNNVTNNTLDVIIDLKQIFDDSNLSSIWNSEFIIENLSTSNEELILQVYDGIVKTLDVCINDQDVQKYNLGISNNNKIYIKGTFNAKIYIQGL